MNTLLLRLSVLCLAPVFLFGATSLSQNDIDTKKQLPNTVTVQYLEIVTSSMDETCEVLGKAHNVDFSDPIPEFGNARSADLIGGGRIGVRAPMRESEAPVVRPYLLVKDIESAVKDAELDGAEIAIPPMKIPGQGAFSIYILGGIEHGLWQK